MEMTMPNEVITTSDVKRPTASPRVPGMRTLDAPDEMVTTHNFEAVQAKRDGNKDDVKERMAKVRAAKKKGK